MKKLINGNLKTIITYLVIGIFIFGGYFVKFNATEAKVDNLESSLRMQQDNVEQLQEEQAGISSDLDWIKCSLVRIENKIDSHISRGE
jgi:peptidoglycan hydrolase CwlO-like protein